MRTVIDVVDIKSTKDKFAVTLGEEHEVAETEEEAVSEAFKIMQTRKIMPSVEGIDATSFIEILKELGYIIMSEDVYGNATDPMYDE